VLALPFGQQLAHVHVFRLQRRRASRGFFTLSDLRLLLAAMLAFTNNSNSSGAIFNLSPGFKARSPSTRSPLTCVPFLAAEKSHGP